MPSATDFPDKQNLALHTPSAVQCQQNKCSLIKTDKSTSEPSFHLARANRETAISNASTISVQYYSWPNHLWDLLIHNALTVLNSCSTQLWHYGTGILKYWYVQHVSLTKGSCLTLHANGLRTRLIFLISPGCIAWINLEMKRATSTHKLVSFSRLMHRNKVIHDQGKKYQSVLSGAGCKRHLLAEECTILKELPVALLLLHTACTLLRMKEREQTVREREWEKKSNEQVTMMDKTKGEEIGCHTLTLWGWYYIAWGQGVQSTLLISLQSIS